VPILRAALEALLVDSVAGAAVPYAVTAVTFGPFVQATLDGDGRSFVLQIAPADARACYRRTGRFSISYRGTSLDRSASAALEAACDRIAAWERSLAAGVEALLFTPPRPPQDGHRFELLAVRCGVKPTCRIVVPPGAGQEVVESAHRLGLHARRAEARRYSGSAADLAHLHRTAATALVLVGRTAADLAALVQAEEQGAGQVEVGALLGYPRCCVEAFVAQQEQPKPVIRFAALRRTGPTASHLLNDLDEKAGLVSHLVCRYDCAPSIHLAGAVLEELAREAPDDAAAFAAALRGLMVAFHDGGALRLVPGADSVPPRYRIAAVHPAGDGPSIWSWRAALVGADALDVRDRSVRVLCGEQEVHRLETPAERIQIRPFT
jgi:hypothetical protein